MPPPLYGPDYQVTPKPAVLSGATGYILTSVVGQPPDLFPAQDGHPALLIGVTDMVVACGSSGIEP